MDHRVPTRLGHHLAKGNLDINGLAIIAVVYLRGHEAEGRVSMMYESTSSPDCSSKYSFTGGCPCLAAEIM
jgi:hypothetical protein